MTTRTAINPTSWSINLGFDQAELVEGHERLLVCSAQDAMDADGNPQHPGDMAAQVELSLDNLQAVLAAADMTLANVVRLNFYATDVGELLRPLPKGERPLRGVTLRDHRARRRAATSARVRRDAGGNRS